MKEKRWRQGLVEKMEGHPVSGANPTKAPVTASDMYRDANTALGIMFRELFRFFGGDKAAKKVQVGNSGGRKRTRPAARKGWF